MCLTLYRTVQTFNDPKQERFGKHCGKRKTLWEKENTLAKMLAFSPFPTVFSTLSKREILILATFNLSSARAFN